MDTQTPQQDPQLATHFDRLVESDWTSPSEVLSGSYDLGKLLDECQRRKAEANRFRVLRLLWVQQKLEAKQRDALRAPVPEARP